MTVTASESWQATLRSYDQLSTLPNFEHISAFRALVEQVLPAAVQLNLFASNSHETLIISKNNQGPAPDNLPRVVVEPWRDGNLTIIYCGPGGKEQCPCTSGGAQQVIQTYVNRLVTECSESAATSATRGMRGYG
jgi:hypothetical protein